MRKLQELVQKLSGAVVKGNTERLVSGIFYDSRQVKPEGIFVCITGFRTDGHNFIRDALMRGASVIVAERDVEVPVGVTLIVVPDTRLALATLACAFYDYPAGKLNLIGVTGTNGKTSFTYLTRAIFRKKGAKVGLVGTIANLIDDRAIPSHHTTPEASDLQELFSLMAHEGVSHAVMEVSSHALELNRVAGTEFDVAVFTNLTQDHLDFHPDMHSYLEAKAKLFRSLGPGSKERSKYAVLNLDDPNSAYLAGQTQVSVVSYGLTAGAMYRARDIEIRMDGTAYTLDYPHGSFRLNLQLAGKFSVYNSLAACAVGLEEGLEPQLVQEALEEMEGVPGRFQLVNCGQDFAVVVDYAHTPDSLENVLKTARQVTAGRVITVFGCGGDRDRSKRPIMGEKAGELSDYCIITSDNPRSEEPRAIIADIEPGVIRAQGKYQVVVDRREAIAAAISLARPGDVIVIAGKGHESYQIIGDNVLPFDDVAVAREILTK
ncbi:UDP-N-acetylmuramoyl-L-alanyl-D-glutamate--2,6-diaminopimelate ligase [Zhaonella formicivorans]|uniref:UDP-N-acetylmuramoyl-L-alanyl-D-glutamate--2, 6-diaminopimelate ligase n=1 Tax=Zhaonella formicivorans TaxID=2528593 RepID=UPI001D124D6F|nr:UDP-N-acetylmuramoyl-L-alanyl-D-glutamate--2,6-diaminopimelate ligase [Zhaonella formicivorans]